MSEQQVKPTKANMKRLFKKIALLFIALLIINVALFVGFTDKYLHKPYQAQPFNKELNTVLLADSHGGAISREVLKNQGIFKFTSSGDNYIDMYAKLTYYHENNPQLDTAFLTVDDHTLSAHKDSKNNNALSVVYMDSKYYQLAYESGKWNYVYDKFLKRYLPLLDVNNAGLIKFAIISKYRSVFNEDYGKTAEWQVNPEKLEASISRKKDHFPSDLRSASLTQALKLIIQYCEQNNIALIGLKFPLDGTYLKVIEGEGYGADDILKKSGFDVIDLKNAFSTQPELFANQDHLNAEGAILFLDSLEKQLEIMRY